MQIAWIEKSFSVIICHLVYYEKTALTQTPLQIHNQSSTRYQLVIPRTRNTRRTCSCNNAMIRSMFGNAQTSISHMDNYCPDEFMKSLLRRTCQAFLYINTYHKGRVSDEVGK